MFNNQRGSATVLGIGVMMFLTILASATTMLVTSDLNFSKMNSDMIEAQFAAEAGAKKAVAMFYLTSQDWTWVDANSSAQNWHTLSNDENKRYHVKIELGGAQVVPDNPAAAGTYTVTSTGNVGNSSKTVTVQVTVSSSGSGGNEYVRGDIFGKYALYTKGTANIDATNKPQIYGDIGFGGNDITINNSTSNFLHGKLHISNPPPVIKGWRGYPTDWLDSSVYVVDDDVGYLNVTLPDMPSMPTILTMLSVQPDGTTLLTTATSNLLDPAYYYKYSYTRGGNITSTSSQSTIYINGDLQLTNQKPYSYGSITSTGNIVLYVNGNINLNNGSFIRSTGGDITIYASGGLSMSGGSYINSDTGNITIITNSSIILNDSNNYIQASATGTLKAVSRQNSISFNHNCYMNGGVVFLQAKNNVELRQTGSINNSIGYSDALAYIYSNGSVTTNSFTIGGSASLFATTGSFSFSTSFNAPRTIFVSASGQTNVSNQPSIGGLYTNGSLRISNTPTINYDISILAKLGLTGSAGTAVTEVKNWSN